MRMLLLRSIAPNAGEQILSVLSKTLMGVKDAVKGDGVDSVPLSVLPARSVFMKTSSYRSVRKRMGHLTVCVRVDRASW